MGGYTRYYHLMITTQMNKYFRFKEKKSIPPGGELNVAQLDIELPAVQSLELEGFFSFFGPCYLSFGFSSKSVLNVHSLF